MADVDDPKGSLTSSTNSVSKPNSRRKARKKKAKKGRQSGLAASDTKMDLDELRLTSKGTGNRVSEVPEEIQKRLEKMPGAVRTLLECVGEDPDREGLRATPSRYAEALLHLTQGYQVNVETLVNDALFHEGHNEMIIVKDIDVCSLCEHHLVPFNGKIHIGYIPDGTVIGLSKLARITKMFSQRLQIQERITKEVADTIMKVLNPRGVAVVMEATHLCMVMRGVKMAGTTTITTCFLGWFEQNPESRTEFLGLVGVNQ